MIKSNPNEKIIFRGLGDGLVLRRSSMQDADALAEFNATIHSDDGPEYPDDKVAAWTSDLLTRPHPSFDVGDFTIVEDTAGGKIVSTMNLISQTWSYAGIKFKVGRPELVGTLLEYRNRGLVRAQFEVIHQWSAERGEVVQAITGIPYYYRLFGYEMAMNLGGGRLGYLPNVPKLKGDEQEAYHIRPAGAEDLPQIMDLYELGCRRSLVSCVWSEQDWLYELNGKSEKNVNRTELRVIENSNRRTSRLFCTQLLQLGEWCYPAAIVIRVKTGGILGSSNTERHPLSEANRRGLRTGVGKRAVRGFWLLAWREPSCIPGDQRPPAAGAQTLRLVPARARPARFSAPDLACAGGTTAGFGLLGSQRRAKAHILPEWLTINF